MTYRPRLLRDTVESNFKQPKIVAKNPLRQDGKQRKRPNRKVAAWRQARAFVEGRSRGRCEGRVENVCTGRGEHVHHVILRSRGGPDEPWNLLHLCHACHGWVHANPDASTARGLMRSGFAS